MKGVPGELMFSVDLWVLRGLHKHDDKIQLHDISDSFNSSHKLRSELAFIFIRMFVKNDIDERNASFQRHHTRVSFSKCPV